MHAGIDRGRILYTVANRGMSSDRMSSLSDLWNDEFKRDVLLMAVSAVALVLSFAGVKPVEWLDLAWIAIVLCGVPILYEAGHGLLFEHDIRADVLVALAIVAAVCLGEFFAAGEVALIMQIGGCLEEYSSRKATKGMEHLISLTPKTIRLVVDGSERTVAVEDARVGQIARVLPGEAVPVDGRIVSGSTSIDQSVITGESIPVDRSVGDSVYSGSMNQAGSFDMEVTKESGDSSLQRMAQMVESADAGKSRMVRLADRWATYLVAIVMALVVVTYAVTEDIYRAVTIMIVFCPCAFILATPTAVVAAMGNLTRRGVLVKDGDSLERLAQVDMFAFDKTGTITEGRPSVVDVRSEMEEAEFLAVVASAESRSEHPLGRAIVSYAEDRGVIQIDPSEFMAVIGRGVTARVSGSSVSVGNAEMMEGIGVSIPSSYMEHVEALYSFGCTSVFVAVDGVFVGTISMSDTIREESKRMISELGRMGVGTMMLTGDNPRSASFIASSAGIGDFRAECTPEVKMDVIGEMEDGGSRVCMVGDGVNDAPALKRAWVGIAMGGTGSDIAVDAADMALVGNRMDSVPHTLDVSRRMVRKVRVNIAFSLVWNFIAVALSMMAVLGPVEGALVHNVGSVAVVVNSALLLFYRREESEGTR